MNWSLCSPSGSLIPIPFALIEAAEADSWEEITRNASVVFRDRLGVAVRRVRGAVLVIASRSDMLAINRVWLPGADSNEVGETLDEVIDYARMAGISKLLAHCPPWAAPADVFAQRAFSSVGPMTKHFRRATPDLEAASPFRIEVITSRDRKLFGEIAAIGNDAPPFMADGFNSTVGDPGWHHYLAFDGDTPVAAAALRAFDDVAWCCFAGTVPSHRRQGAQAALLAKRVRDAAALGCSWVTCESVSVSPTQPSQSLRNMVRAGFAAAYDRPTFLLDLAASAATGPNGSGGSDV